MAEFGLCLSAYVGSPYVFKGNIENDRVAAYIHVLGFMFFWWYFSCHYLGTEIDREKLSVD